MSEISKSDYIAAPEGCEISGSMYGIPEDIIRDNKKIKEIVIGALKQDNFTVLGNLDEHFNPHGYTIVVLLAESHLAIHTYPEYNSLYFGIYSCRGPNDGKKTYDFLKKKLKPSSVSVNSRVVKVR